MFLHCIGSSGMRKYINKISSCTKRVWLTVDDTGRMCFGWRKFLTGLRVWGWPSRATCSEISKQNRVPQIRPSLGQEACWGETCLLQPLSRHPWLPFSSWGPGPELRNLTRWIEGALCLGVQQWVPTTLQSPPVPLTWVLVVWTVTSKSLSLSKVSSLVIPRLVCQNFSIFQNFTMTLVWLPWWLRWYRICLHCRRPGFNPWVGKISRREWLPVFLFLPVEFHGKRSLVGYSKWGCKESDTTKGPSLTHLQNYHHSPK